MTVTAQHAGRRIGLLGGTFDPPHYGHLHLAQTAQAQLALDEVWFLPVGDPTHKQRLDLTPVADRVAMTVLAIAPFASFRLDLGDIVRPEPHYTSTLLPLIRAAEPTAALWLLLGSDSLRDLHLWHQPAEVVAQARLAVMPRPAADVDWTRLTAIHNLRARIDWLEGAQLAISSTAIRAMRDPEAAVELMPLAVRRYLASRMLYRAAPLLESTP